VVGGVVGIPALEWREASTWDWAGKLVRELVVAEYPPTINILDVGAGWGKYRDVLHDFPNVDACEIWLPYVIKEQLDRRYRRVYTQDIFDLVTSTLASYAYDLFIFGDVLEHLDSAKAKAVLRSILPYCQDVIVIVPYEYEQDEEDGNVYERHLQPDLTTALMTERYPELKLVATEVKDGRDFKGLYRRSDR